MTLCVPDAPERLNGPNSAPRQPKITPRARAGPARSARSPRPKAAPPPRPRPQAPRAAGHEQHQIAGSLRARLPRTLILPIVLASCSCAAAAAAAARAGLGARVPAARRHQQRARPRPARRRRRRAEEALGRRPGGGGGPRRRGGAGRRRGEAPGQTRARRRRAGRVLREFEALLRGGLDVDVRPSDGRKAAGAARPWNRALSLGTDTRGRARAWTVAERDAAFLVAEMRRVARPLPAELGGCRRGLHRAARRRRDAGPPSGRADRVAGFVFILSRG